MRLTAKTQRPRRRPGVGISRPTWLILCVLCVFAVQSPASAQDGGGVIVIDPGLPDAPVVRASLSATEVGLGEVFYLFVAVDHQPGVEVNLPAALPIGPDFEETARTDRLIKNPAGGLTREFEVALMAFTLGDRLLPPVPVTWAAHGQVAQVASAPLAISVVGVIGEGDAELRDIAPPVDVLRRDLTLAWIAGGALGAVVLAVIVWRLARRRRRRVATAVAAAEALRPPHDEALARLAAVEGSGALGAEDRKPVYLELSEIVRGYLARRYGFPARDLTTGEIRTRLAALPDPGEALARIADWLERCDLVKYAKGSATEDEARQALYEARIFVERTREDAAAPATPPARAVGGAS
jgi:hypothetical protein